MKKNNKRGLEQKQNLKIRQELLDSDYLGKLNLDELCWLNNFNLEYVGAQFKHEGRRIHKKKLAIKIEKKSGKEIVYDVARKDCEDRNNSRNRDSFGITKMNNILSYDLKACDKAANKNQNTTVNQREDLMIDLIDLKDAILKRKNGQS